MQGGEEQQRLLLRDAAGAHQELVLPALGGVDVRDCAFSPDGRSLVVAYGTRTVLHELDGFQERTLAGFTVNVVRLIELSRDGKELVTFAYPFSGGSDQIDR